MFLNSLLRVLLISCIHTSNNLTSHHQGSDRNNSNKQANNERIQKQRKWGKQMGKLQNREHGFGYVRFSNSVFPDYCKKRHNINSFIEFCLSLIVRLTNFYNQTELSRSITLKINGSQSNRPTL